MKQKSISSEEETVPSFQFGLANNMLKRISKEMQCNENNTSVRTNQHTPNGKRVTIVQLYLYENTKQSMKVKTAWKCNR